MAKDETKPSVRPLYEIAREIKKDWKNIYFGARVYLDAMAKLDSINDQFGFGGDETYSAKETVRYFLFNASKWRGEKAREIKKELKELIK